VAFSALIFPDRSNRLTADFSTGLPAREERACEIAGPVETLDVHACVPGFARA
jgi:hypothetical protein